MESKMLLLKVFVICVWPVTCEQGLKDLLTPLKEYGETCGYESCPLTQPGTLNVHIVPHTHAELGYSRNFEQYYTGNDDFFPQRQVNMKQILDFVITELWWHPERKFTLSATSYLFHWWSKRDATVHRMVYELIRQGRLVLVGGGFTMSNEASVSYQAVIDHYTYSLRSNGTGRSVNWKINSTFMECGRPLVAWQADTFGHSREFASLIAQMGFDALFLNPISYDDELSRMLRQGLEFLWRGSDDIGPDSDIFTHKLFDGYWSPPGFCFGLLCTDPHIISSDKLRDNVDERVDKFIELMTNRQAPHYATGNVMVMMGHRFAYFDARTWFRNIEELIDFVNKKCREKGLKIALYYSTPPCYLKAVNEANPVLETKQDDFFPYVYDNKSYCVGLYTSRPTLKYIVREGYVYLQVAKQVQVTANLGNNDKQFEEFMWIMSVIQDHSILSGSLHNSAKRYYVKKLDAAITKSTVIISSALRNLRNSTYIRYNRCMFNISYCNETRLIRHSLQIYNPLGWPVTVPVRIPVNIIDSKFKVYDLKGRLGSFTCLNLLALRKVTSAEKKRRKKLSSSVVKSVTVKTPAPIRNIKGRPNSTHEVVFLATDIPPIGFRSYFVQADYYRPKRAIIKKLKMAQNKKYFIRQINPLKIVDVPVNEMQEDDYNDDIQTQMPLHTTEESRDIFDYEYDSFRPTGETNDMQDIFVPPRRTTVIHNTTIPATNRINMEFVTQSVYYDEEASYTTFSSETLKPALSTTKANTEVITERFNSDETTNKSTIDVETTTEATITTASTTTESAKDKYFEVKEGGDNLFIGNKYVRLNLDSNKRIASLVLCNGVNISLNIELYYHVSDDPIKFGREDDKQPGAYIFRPMDRNRMPMAQGYNVAIVKNSIVEEIHLNYNDWAFLMIRLYAESPVIELNWLIGPIPTEDELGKDVFIRYSTDLENEGVFYTDANGRQTIKRIRNMRATYEPVDLDDLAGNLYPVTSKIYIEDLKRNIRFSIFNDRSQAGGSLQDGKIDLMVHRKVLTEDVNGVFLNETEYGEGLKVIGTHYLYLTKGDHRKNRIFEKKFAKEIEMAPRVMASARAGFKSAGMKEEFYKCRNEFSALKKKLPVGVHLLTLEKWWDNILIRLENYLEKSDALKSGVKTVFLKELFTDINILSIRETTLAANMYKDEWAPKRWQIKEKFYRSFNEYYGGFNKTYEEDSPPQDEGDLESGIKLSPQQIRTFVASYKYVGK